MLHTFDWTTDFWEVMMGLTSRRLRDAHQILDGRYEVDSDALDYAGRRDSARRGFQPPSRPPSPGPGHTHAPYYTGTPPHPS